jgi:hypothetical protein
MMDPSMTNFTTMDEVPEWVLDAVSPTRERGPANARVKRELWTVASNLALVVIVAAIQRQHFMNNVVGWVVLGGAVGAAVRASKSRAAIRWLDRENRWGAIATLPKTKTELSAVRFRIPDMLFYSVVGAVLFGIAFAFAYFAFK